ncbi:hypothetical protein [Bradyrhizobium elkanii]|uniref:TSCPD domain-containing protein n=1 Tax=Bradyrhizobium elkanii TaxID=29448 RepID=UPI003514C13A
MTRATLPNRRSHEVFNFYHWGRKFIAGVGHDQSGSVREVWINSGKSGEQMETLARDSAVLLSLALQYSIPLDAMRKTIMRDLDGKASGPIGKLLDLLAEGDGLSQSQPVLPVVSGIDGAECASRGETVEI